MSKCSLLEATFPNCTVDEQPNGSENFHIKPELVDTEPEQYCIIIEDYIQTLGFETQTVTSSDQPYIEAREL